MKEDILKLISASNSKEDGIYIPQELEIYLNKLFNFSKIVAVYENGKFQGFISYYKNDPKKQFGFLSMLLINRECQSSGIGSLLLKSAIEDLKINKFMVFQLEVLKTNEKAIKLYYRFGFKTTKEKEELLVMELQLS